MCKQIVLSMCTAQCGSMEAKALNFVLRAASSEHYKSSTRRVFTYVVGGRVGMNDTCYFTLDMKKLVPPPHHQLRSILHACKFKERPPHHPIGCVALHVCKFQKSLACLQVQGTSTLYSTLQKALRVRTETLGQERAEGPRVRNEAIFRVRNEALSLYRPIPPAKNETLNEIS